MAALQAGAIDVAEYLSPRELALVEKIPGVTVHKVFGNYIHRVEMQNETAPFTDPRVRQALNYLVPRDEISQAVYFGTARPTKSPISEIYPAFTDAYFPYDHNVEKAKALLAEAGYPDGFTTELGYRTGDMWAPQLATTEALLTEARHFAECVETGKRPLTDGQAGLNVVRILEAASASIRNRGQPVELE